LVDIFPSLCELVGIDVPDYMQGTSFVPLLKKPDLPWKKAAFSQFHRRPRVSADGKRYMGYSINTEKYHYIEWYTWDNITKSKGAYQTSELYDRIKDPTEKVNIAAEKENEALVKELSQQLTEGWRKALPKRIINK
jgi:iduronate 2-sulfatase